MRNAPKYPHIFVRVRDIHSHIGMVSRVADAMRERGVELSEINHFRLRANNTTSREEAMQIISEWVDTDKDMK